MTHRLTSTETPAKVAKNMRRIMKLLTLHYIKITTNRTFIEGKKYINTEKLAREQ